MIPYAEARALVCEEARRRVPQRELVRVPLAAAAGKVLAETLVATQPIPRFRNSAMEGFAVRSAETTQASETSPAVLAVTASLAAGQTLAPGVTLGHSACEIMTGAPVPDFYDAVVRVEDIHREGHRIVLRRSVTAGDNVRDAGEDFRQGTPLIAPGTLCAPEHLLALASFGFSDVATFRAPRVAVLSTGTELVPLGEPLGPSQIYNSNTPYLLAALRGLGAEAEYFGNIADEPKAFHRLLERLLAAQVDVVVSTGAVSMGKYDFIAPALADLQAEILFHKVAIRPGKPILFAHWGARSSVVFFGLPGNPVSTAVGLRFFVEPYLRALQSRPPEKMLALRLRHAVEKPANLRCFFKATLDLSTRQAEVLPGQASFMVSPLLVANGWIALAEGNAQFAEGTEIEAVPLAALAYEGRRSL